MTLIVSSRSSRPVFGLGGHVDELDLAAPLDRLEALRRHLRADTGRVGALLVDLVDRDEHRDLGRLGVVDGLLRLRLHAVVGRDHDDRDVGDARAAGAHGGERLVARGVEEGDRLAALVDLVGADVLGDATGLAGDDLGLADRVEQRRLAVVDVAHDRDDRRALDEVGVVVVGLDDLLVLLGDGDDLDLLVELLGEQLDRLVGERLRERRHLAQAHELLDDLGDRDAEVLGDVLDRRAGGDPDEVGRLLRGAVDRGERLGLEVATATATAATTAARAALLALRGAAGTAGTAARAGAASRLRVDDDAAPSAGTGRAGSAGALAHAVVARRARALRAGPARAAGTAGATGAALLAGCGPRAALARGVLLLAGPRDAAPGALGRRAGAERAHRAGARSGGRSRLAVARTVLRGLDLLAGERVLGLLLVDRGGHGLDGDAGSLELREHVPRGHARLLGEFVDALLGHWVFSLSGSWLLNSRAERSCPAAALRGSGRAVVVADVGTAAGQPAVGIVHGAAVDVGETAQGGLVGDQAAAHAPSLR
jgi:hypothetical protein